MSDESELQSVDTTPISESSRIRPMLMMIGGAVILGGLALWITWPASDDVAEVVVEELDDIPAATAPPIVPATNEPSIDVPGAIDLPSPIDPAPAGASYIPPVDTDAASPSEPLDMPAVELLSDAPSSIDARRSRLRDALNASISVEVKEFLDDENEEPELTSAVDGDLPDRQHVLIPGTVIPAVLLQGINTDLPGIAVAHVGRDVHDSRTGRHCSYLVAAASLAPMGSSQSNPLTRISFLGPHRPAERRGDRTRRGRRG